MKKQIEKMVIFAIVFIISSIAFAIITSSSERVFIGKAIAPINGNCISGSYDCVDDTLMFCNMGKWESQKKCPFGCKDNICISSEKCIEGETKCNNDYLQKCIDNKWINSERCSMGCKNNECIQGTQCVEGEFQCNNEYMQYCKAGVWFNKKRCLSGCKSGACIEFTKEMFCKDSDNGNNVSIKGKTTGLNRFNQFYSKSDECLAENEIIEFWCNDNWLVEERHLCEGKCENGRCIEVEEEPEPFIQQEEENLIVDTIEPITEVIIPEKEQKGFFSALYDWFSELF